MLAKIKFDGKEHLAIVLNEYTDFDEIHAIKKAMNTCLCCAVGNEDSLLPNEILYDYISFINEMETNEKQTFEMFTSYFGDGKNSRNKVEKKDCEIYF